MADIGWGIGPQLPYRFHSQHCSQQLCQRYFTLVFPLCQNISQPKVMSEGGGGSKNLWCTLYKQLYLIGGRRIGQVGFAYWWWLLVAGCGLKPPKTPSKDLQKKKKA